MGSLEELGWVMQKVKERKRRQWEDMTSAPIQTRGHELDANKTGRVDNVVMIVR